MKSDNHFLCYAIFCWTSLIIIKAICMKWILYGHGECWCAACFLARKAYIIFSRWKMLYLRIVKSLVTLIIEIYLATCLVYAMVWLNEIAGTDNKKSNSRHILIWYISSHNFKSLPLKRRYSSFHFCCNFKKSESQVRKKTFADIAAVILLYARHGCTIFRESS